MTRFDHITHYNRLDKLVIMGYTFSIGGDILMDKAEITARIAELESQIAELPRGSVVYKNIKGKKWPYLQWTEGGKSKSQFVKEDELELVSEQVAQRKAMQAELKSLKAKVPKQVQPVLPAFRTNVITGSALTAMTEGIKSWKKRDCFATLQKYLKSKATDRVCLIYGLRRTGKTTMLRQAVLEMTAVQASHTAYIKARSTDTMADINQDLTSLATLGYKYILLDEVTLMRDFIDSAALFSDVYAAQGMKIVLSGTDSLGFWFALDQELYDRAITIHTTYIPFREHSRLLGINSIDEYIRYGGTLRAGELGFDDEDVNAEYASFRDDESTRRYIDTAICKNIQHSLSCCEAGGHFRHLQSLYEAKELTSAINRIIESMNHEFLVSVLADDFKSHDLGSSAQILRDSRNESRRTDILDRVDREAVTKRLMELLDIRNKEDQTIGITQAHVAEIKEYLKALDLIIDCPIETTVAATAPVEHVLFTQPGMRYSQAQALVHSLMKDAVFSSMPEFEKKRISERILEEVLGRLMEEIVLLETVKTAGKKHRVFKLQFGRGEFDMVVYDTDANTFDAYEIKHSKEAVPEQYRVLMDAERCSAAENRFGKLLKRIVLYRGTAFTESNGVEYRNVEKYLSAMH